MNFEFHLIISASLSLQYKKSKWGFLTLIGTLLQIHYGYKLLNLLEGKKYHTSYTYFKKSNINTISRQLINSGETTLTALNHGNDNNDLLSLLLNNTHSSISLGCTLKSSSDSGSVSSEDACELNSLDFTLIFEANFGNSLVVDLEEAFKSCDVLLLIDDLERIFLYSDVLWEVSVQCSDCSFGYPSLSDRWTSITENVIRLRGGACCCGMNGSLTMYGTL